jgi:large subunit ribosomal protein L24e
MVKCVFCGKDEDSYKGIHVIWNDGMVRYYCSGKCRKNAMVLKRDKRKIKWAEAFHVSREKARARASEVSQLSGVVENEKKKEA